MKKPITIISNDWHLRKDNIQLIKNIVKQKCELANELNVNQVFVLGDVFDSRKGQSQEVLIAFTDVLDIFHEHKIKAIIIPGNHDKANYSSEESYLEPYYHHPAIELYKDCDDIDLIEGIRIHLIPFFEEQVWLEKLKPNLLKGGKNLLFTHIGVTGSTNNDGSLVQNGFNKEIFKDFDKVFSGHYHENQVIWNKFVHCPSLFQANFGENDLKGFTVLYDDLTYEIRRSVFPRYVKIKIDLDTISNQELAVLTKENTGTDNFVRFEISGAENKLKSLKKDVFTDCGIDVKTKIKEITDSIELTESDEVVSFDSSNIIEEFEKFCEEQKLDVETGMKYLNKKLNG